MPIIIAALLVAQPPAPYPLESLAEWQRIWGPEDVTAITGAGALTATVNNSGRVTGVRWPAPGYFDQISYRTYDRDQEHLGVAETDGISWGVVLDGATHWLWQDGWRHEQEYTAPRSFVIRTESHHTASDLRINQSTFVHLVHPILVTHVRITGVDLPPALRWFANFTPCTRALPSVPVADWLLDSLNDFATFYDSDAKRVYHFRPKGPGASDWEQAEQFLRAPENADWTVFRDGVWIAYAASPNPTVARCDDEQAFTNNDAIFAEPPKLAYAGQGASMIELQPTPEDHGITATVFIAFGSSKAEADETLSLAEEKGYEQLLDETELITREAMPVTPRLEGAPDAVLRDAITLAMCTNRETGSVVRSPITQPPLALDWLQNASWIILAYDYLGLHDRAARLIDYYGEEITNTRADDGPFLGLPPAASYGNHVPAVPRTVADIEGLGRLLWSTWRHIDALPDSDRTSRAADLWETVVLGADFVANWVDGKTGYPLHTFDPELLHDTRPVELVLTGYLALSAALSIAEVADETPPATWSARLDEFEILMRTHCLEDRHWNVETLPIWWKQLLQDDDPNVRRLIERERALVENGEGLEQARALSHLALYWRNNAIQLASLRELARAHVWTGNGRSISADPVPDALAAALRLIAARIIGWESP